MDLFTQHIVKCSYFSHCWSRAAVKWGTKHNNPNKAALKYNAGWDCRHFEMSTPCHCRDVDPHHKATAVTGWKIRSTHFFFLTLICYDVCVYIWFGFRSGLSPADTATFTDDSFNSWQEKTSLYKVMWHGEHIFTQRSSCWVPKPVITPCDCRI